LVAGFVPVKIRHVVVGGRERIGKKCGDCKRAAQRTCEWSALVAVMVEE